MHRPQVIHQTAWKVHSLARECLLESTRKSGKEIEDYPDLERWYQSMEARPAVRRAMEVGEELRRPIEDLDEEARDVLFGGKRRSEGR